MTIFNEATAKKATDSEMLFAKTGDGVITKVSKETIVLSPMVKKWIDTQKEMGNPACEIELKEINSDQLKKVLLWLERHKDQPAYDFACDETTGDRSWVELSEEDKALFETMDLHEYASLLRAAHFMDVDSLRFAVAQTIASQIKDRSVEEIRDYFGEPDDLSEERKESIRREDIWAHY